MMCPHHSAVDHVGDGDCAQRFQHRIEDARLKLAPIAVKSVIPLPRLFRQSTLLSQGYL